MELSESPKYSRKSGPSLLRAHEHKAAVDLHVGNLRQSVPVGRNRKCSFPGSRPSAERSSGCRRGDRSSHGTGQRSVLPTVPSTGTDHPGALVRAAVQEKRELPRRGPRSMTRRRTGDFRRIKVARLRDLTVVTHVNPGVAPETLKLQLVQLLRNIKVAMHGIRPHQRAQGLGIACVGLAVHREEPGGSDNGILCVRTPKNRRSG